MRIRVIAVVLLAALALIAAGSVSATTFSARHATSSLAVKTRKIKGLGTVLVNAKGRTLYVFAKDKQSKVTCTGSCAQYWPPLKWKSAGKPRAGGSAKSKLLGTDANPGGGKVVTYNRWPLYTYVGDSAPGQASGQNQNLNGGKWYVISPKGKAIKHP